VSEKQSPTSFFKKEYNAFLAAVQFLTRVPITLRLVPDSAERYQETLTRGVIYFPLVGAMITATTAIVTLVLSNFLPAELAVVSALAFEAMLTGAFHEDALADTCDALGGGWTRDQVLEILKDSRLGTYGTLGLTLSVLCRFSCLVALAKVDYMIFAAAMVASGALARWGIIWLMHLLDPVEDRHTLARAVGGRTGRVTIFLSAILALPAVGGWILLDPLGLLAAIVVSAVVLVLYRKQVLRRVGGSTGDLLGCVGYLIQLSVLIVAVARFVS
jgi:adenosylcobinamide-GDP ribazoletransferase